MPAETAARELLELEREYQRTGLDQTATELWQTLAEEVFGRAHNAHHRRSFRLPTEVSATVKIRHGTFGCSITDVSLVGLTLAGQVFAYISDEDPVELARVRIGSRDSEVNLRCRVIHFGQSLRGPTVGLALAVDNADDAMQRFSDDVYYPLYLRYLEHLAEGKPGSGVSKAA
jgi:hypothetical protein